MKYSVSASQICLISFSCYQKHANAPLLERYRCCPPPSAEDAHDAGMLMGFVSGVVGLYTEHEAVKEWVDQHLSPFARWVVYRDGWLTFFAHQSRTMFDNFFGDDAPRKVQEVIDGRYSPGAILKPMPRGKGFYQLHEPEFRPTPSGELLVDNLGILHILSDGACLQLEPGLRLEQAVSSVVFKNSFIENNFQEHPEFH